MDRDTAGSPVTRGAKARGKWRVSLRMFLLAITVLGAGAGIVGMLVRRNVEHAKINRAIDPILTRHEATVAVNQGDFVWLSLSGIDPSDAGIPELHQLGITHFYSSAGLQGTSPVRDADLIRLLDRMPNLRALDLRKTSTTEAILAHVSKLEKLEWLWLDAAHCTDASLERLTGLHTLRRLGIDGTQLPEASLNKLQASLPECRIQTKP